MNMISNKRTAEKSQERSEKRQLISRDVGFRHCQRVGYLISSSRMPNMRATQTSRLMIAL